MRKRIVSLGILTAMTLIFVSCGQEQTVGMEGGNYTEAAEHESGTEAAGSESNTETVEQSTENLVYEATLEEVEALLGMQDSETADLLGGGAENWTEDKNFYIGRIYEIKLYDEVYPAFTTCDDEKMVNAASVWLADGEQELTEAEVGQWVERLTDYVGEEAKYDEISSEAGTKKWEWFSEERVISLMWTGDLLSINMNIVAGEIK